MYPRPFLRVFALLTLPACGAWLAPAVSAQSLADVARKEEARRKSVEETSREPSKVYTNKDLDALPPPPPVQEATPAEADKKDDAAKDKGKDKDAEPAKDQKDWSGRAADLRTQLDRDQMFAEALQSRINALTTDFVNRDDPAQRAGIERDRQKAIAELDRVTKQIETDKKAISDLDEEARKAGVPPGWLRP